VMTSLTHHLPNGQVSTGVLKKSNTGDDIINTSPAKWPGKYMYRCTEEGLIQVMTSLTHHLPNGQVSTGVLKKVQYR
jgi:hypothetical protein